jgi:DNA-binding beta-propeller fold protein YncE
VQAVYVADAGNQRIVELSKEGDYVRQFRPRAGEAITFDDLRDVFVDEISGRMYILNGNSLYGSTLPVQ